MTELRSTSVSLPTDSRTTLVGVRRMTTPLVKEGPGR